MLPSPLWDLYILYCKSCLICSSKFSVFRLILSSEPNSFLMRAVRGRTHFGINRLDVGQTRCRSGKAGFLREKELGAAWRLWRQAVHQVKRRPVKAHWKHAPNLLEFCQRRSKIYSHSPKRDLKSKVETRKTQYLLCCSVDLNSQNLLRRKIVVAKSSWLYQLKIFPRWKPLLQHIHPDCFQEPTHSNHINRIKQKTTWLSKNANTVFD